MQRAFGFFRKSMPGGSHGKAARAQFRVAGLMCVIEGIFGELAIPFNALGGGKGFQ